MVASVRILWGLLRGNGLEGVGMNCNKELFAVSSRRRGQMLSFAAWTPTKDH
jgi:hypothetical protein